MPSIPHKNEPLPSPIITNNEHHTCTRLRSKGAHLLSVRARGSFATKSEEQVPHLDESKREKGRKKFFEESGVHVEEVGAIVLDEVSFVEAKMLGHFDAVMRQLTGNLKIMFGGVPVLLVRAAALTRHLPAFAAGSNPPPASICC